MKNLVVCSDGTGNSNVKKRGTNVYKLYEAVDTHDHRARPELTRQMTFYDDGVGTQSLKWLKLISGAFGLGLSRNVRQLYAEICRVYEPGDQIYLFGFSRGAFTVRTLAGLLGDCGVVDQSHWDSEPELHSIVRRAWRAHKRRYRAWIGRKLLWFLKSSEEVTTSFRRRYSRGQPVAIKFMGVWDTVAAHGFPVAHFVDIVNTLIWRFSFPDLLLGAHVERASQAIAIDDERKTFKPMLWDQTGADDAQRIQQTWFAGMHANVGGGYPQHGMSLVSLRWMIDAASAQSLRFRPSKIQQYREEQNVHDKMHDSRAGFGIYYRYAPRDIHALCRRAHCSPAIHHSVIERITENTAGYAPGNLPLRFLIDDGGVPAAFPRVSLGSSDPGFQQAKVWVSLRRYAHYPFVLITMAVLGLSVAGVGASSPSKGRSTLASLFDGYIAQIIETIISSPFAVTVIKLVGLIVVFYLTGVLAKKRITRRYSAEWVKLRRLSTGPWYATRADLSDDGV